jgi:hypothetical protein
MSNSTKIQLSIPDTIRFADLNLAFDPSGGISFNWEPIERICGHNGMSADIFKRQHEDNVAGLITHWYAQHLAAGGERDQVADELIAETALEEVGGLGAVEPPSKNQ